MTCYPEPTLDEMLSDAVIQSRLQLVMLWRRNPGRPVGVP